MKLGPYDLDQCHFGDAGELARALPDGSVQCIVTSPPYWGLRCYGTEDKVWGGDPDCDHDWREGLVIRKGSTNGREDLGSTLESAGAEKTLAPGKSNDRGGALQYREDWSAFCQKCGAWQGSLGLEPTPEMYVDHLVEIFRELRRALRDDGTLWLNLGDCYAGSWGSYAPGGIKGEQREQTEEGKRWDRRAYKDTKFRPPTANTGKKYTSKVWPREHDPHKRVAARPSHRRDRRPREDDPHKAAPGLKPKDLVGIPWRVAFALQADGWWLRSDVVWNKPNPMPESVLDRPTKSHEYVFILAKSQRYHYDADAVRERWADDRMGASKNKDRAVEHRIHIGGKTRPSEAPKTEGRNRRSVWTIPVEEDVERAPPKQSEDRKALPGPTYSRHRSSVPGGQDLRKDPTDSRNRRSVWTIPTVPFPGQHFATFPPKLAKLCVLAGCPEGGVVLDPFIGSGTVGQVCQDLGRKWIGFDMDEENASLIKKRTEQTGLFGRTP